MNEIAYYSCSCGCETAVCFIEAGPIPDVECQECHGRASISRPTEFSRVTDHSIDCECFDCLTKYSPRG